MQETAGVRTARRTHQRAAAQDLFLIVRADEEGRSGAGDLERMDLSWPGGGATGQFTVQRGSGTRGVS